MQPPGQRVGDAPGVAELDDRGAGLQPHGHACPCPRRAGRCSWPAPRRPARAPRPAPRTARTAGRTAPPSAGWPARRRGRRPRAARPRSAGGGRRRRRRRPRRRRSASLGSRSAVVDRMGCVRRAPRVIGAGQVVLVVGAEQPPGGPAVERAVQQQLVQLALGELGRPAAGEGRLADAAQPPAGPRVLVQRGRPDADDPGGVDPDLGHVEELHRAGVVAEGVPEQLQPRPRLGDDDHLVTVQALAHERQQTREEVLLPAVEQRLVLEAGAARPAARSCCRTRRTRPARLVQREDPPHAPQQGRGVPDLHVQARSCSSRPTGRGPGRRPRRGTR